MGDLGTQPLSSTTSGPEIAAFGDPSSLADPRPTHPPYSLVKALRMGRAPHLRKWGALVFAYRDYVYGRPIWTSARVAST